MKNIKKLSLILAATFTLGGLSMANANQTREGRKNIDPKVRAEKMTERMAKEYELNDTQKQQLLDLNQTFAEKIGERPAGPNRHGRKGHHGQIDKAKKGDKEMARTDRADRKKRRDVAKPSTEEREKRMTEMKQVRDDYNAQLQKIMNADQYQAFAKKQAERDEKRKERGEKMKENRSKKSASGKKSKEA